MRLTTLLIVFLFTLPCGSRTPIVAQEESVFDQWRDLSLNSPVVDDAIEEFEEEMEELEAAYEEVFKRKKDELIRKLEEARLEATRADELDLAVGIRDLHESIEDAELEMPSSPLFSSAERVSIFMKRELDSLKRLARRHDWDASYFDNGTQQAFIFETFDFEWKLVLEQPHENGSGTTTLIYNPETDSFRGVFVRPSYRNTRTFEVRAK